MAKHTSKEAYYERLKNLANVNKTLVKESKIRNLGSLIDYKRASDGVAYGIVKENHHYYIKKAGTKQDPNVADFAYIGGMGNITDYQCKSLAEADKKRNMMFQVINEAKTLKPNKTKSKMVLTEDVAEKEIDQAISKVPELDAATSAEKAAPEGSAEMAAGLESMPTGPESTEEVPVPDTGKGDTTDSGEGDVATDDTGKGDTTDSGDGDTTDNGDGDTNPEEIPAPEGDEEGKDEIKSEIGKVGDKILNKTLNDEQVNTYVSMFLGYFKENFRNMDITERQDLADEYIINVTTDKEKEDVADAVPQGEPGEGELEPSGLPEAQCAECGSFAQYAESRGYGSAEALMECGEEEVGNLVSGYANAHNDGMNDGDVDNVAMIIKIINPEMLNSLKGDYGHEDYASKLEPIVTGMNECSQEEGVAKINELFGGLKNLGQAAMGGIKAGANAVGGAIGNKFNQAKTAVGGAIDTAKTAVGNAATQVKHTYHAGEVAGEVKKLQDIAANLGKQIEAYNQRKTNAGQPPVDVNSILKAVTQQVTGKKVKGAAALGEEIDPANVAVQPVGQAIEEVKVPEKKGKALSTKAPVKIMKEEDEPEGEEIETDDIEVKDDAGVGEEKPITFAPPAQSLGVATVKPDGAATVGVDINITPDKAVSISMNEGEKKLRKYIRERLEVKAGLRKESINESKKSSTLKKLDAVIDSQFKLYEGVVVKKKVNEGVDEGLGDFVGNLANKVNQSLEGRFKKQRELKATIEANPSMAKSAILKAFSTDLMYNAGMQKFVERSAPEVLAQIAQEAANDPNGLGKLALQGGKIVYIPGGKDMQQ